MSSVKKSQSVVIDITSGRYNVNPVVPEGNDESEIFLKENLKNVSFLSQEAAAKAEYLIAHTIGRSREIVDRANLEAESTIKKAKEQGYSKGNDEGFKLGNEECLRCSLEEKRPLIEAISELETRLSDIYAEKAGNSEYFGFAIELAQRIISLELAQNDEAFFKLYQKAALHIGTAEKATLKAGPRGFAVANLRRGKFMSAIDGLEQLEITLEGKDDGTCILETPLGNIDASTAVQLERAKQIISPQN